MLLRLALKQMPLNDLRGRIEGALGKTLGSSPHTNIARKAAGGASHRDVQEPELERPTGEGPQGQRMCSSSLRLQRSPLRPPAVEREAADVPPTCCSDAPLPSDHVPQACLAKACMHQAGTNTDWVARILRIAQREQLLGPAASFSCWKSR